MCEDKLGPNCSNGRVMCCLRKLRLSQCRGIKDSTRNGDLDRREEGELKSVRFFPQDFFPRVEQRQFPACVPLYSHDPEVGTSLANLSPPKAGKGENVARSSTGKARVNMNFRVLQRIQCPASDSNLESEHRTAGAVERMAVRHISHFNTSNASMTADHNRSAIANSKGSLLPTNQSFVDSTLVRSRVVAKANFMSLLRAPPWFVRESTHVSLRPDNVLRDNSLPNERRVDVGSCCSRLAKEIQNREKNVKRNGLKHLQRLRRRIDAEKDPSECGQAKEQRAPPTYLVFSENLKSQVNKKGYFPMNRPAVLRPLRLAKRPLEAVASQENVDPNAVIDVEEPKCPLPDTVTFRGPFLFNSQC